MKPYRISELATKYVGYDMITAHTELPPFADIRVHLLYAYLSNSSAFRPDDIESIVLAVYLVQLGLDTHDLIDPEDIRKEESLMRARQLNVLAGDYFSSSFYELLSKVGEIQLISTLSQAVSEVNRKKVNLYTKLGIHNLTAEEYLHDKAELKQELFHTFSSRLNSDLIHSYLELLSELSVIETLQEERTAMNSGSLYVSQLLSMQVDTHVDRDEFTVEAWSTMLDTYSVESHLDSKIQLSIQRIQSIVGECSDLRLREELIRIVNPIFVGMEQSGKVS
ncbi:heptaprenyl diphosphate synthase [Paenibacillus shirakamiensis]|uniref:Heptaprenyl diphosphate synthase n=1 Tax=Paenibacillus shirakamiensis TaxID=1265935 RepID=A0ABS4JCU3_9BACL|nr:heptaprenyl diphosphate synthase component 1 [Paenibacillus shirakamiensis]MBP1999534.1 heptaprenyl diphosphate synthase [Paenibacillus shirakamiensis]